MMCWIKLVFDQKIIIKIKYSILSCSFGEAFLYDEFIRNLKYWVFIYSFLTAFSLEEQF